MSTTVMSVKVDKQLKLKAQKVAKKLGFPLGTAVNAFLRQLVRDKAVYFTVEPNELMSEILEKKLAKIENDIDQKIKISPGFDSMEGAIKFLKKK